MRSFSGSARPKVRDSLSITLDSPPGMTSPSTLVELLGAAHQRHSAPELAQHERVLAEIALQREDADAGPAEPRPRVE